MIDYGKELQKAYDDGYKDRDAEIVRCKDCKWFEEYTENGVSEGIGFCTNPVFDVYNRLKTDWFCADGEVATVKGEDNKDSGDVKEDGKEIY